KALYMPALVAIKYNAPLRHFAARLRAAGKPKMSIVCAVMRKLVHIAFGVLKHQKTFNPSLACPSQFTLATQDRIYSIRQNAITIGIFFIPGLERLYARNARGSSGT